MDCLDRTNVVQTAFCREFIQTAVSVLIETLCILHATIAAASIYMYIVIVSVNYAVRCEHTVSIKYPTCMYVYYVYGMCCCSIQLQKLGIIPFDEYLSGATLSTFKMMWANNGDCISRQYTGIAAMKVNTPQKESLLST